MKNFVRISILIIALICGQLVSASVNDILRCVPAVDSKNLDSAKEKASKIIIMSPILGESLRGKAIKCADYAFGDGWVYDKNQSVLVNNSEVVNKNAAKFLSEDQNAIYYQLVADLSYLTENAKARLNKAKKRQEELANTAAQANAERLELEKLQSKLKATIANLEKQASCINAKSYRILNKVEAIDDRLDETNRSLILRDTHKACSSLYSDNQTAAMLNQSCIDAFESMGHPNLILAESEQKSVYSSDLIGLRSLEINVQTELLETKVKLLEVDGVVTECQSQSNKGPNTRGKKGPLHLVVCSALARMLVRIQLPPSD